MDYHDLSSALQLVIIYYHVITINTGYITNDNLIRSQSGDSNPSQASMKGPLCHLSYHPWTNINGTMFSNYRILSRGVWACVPGLVAQITIVTSPNWGRQGAFMSLFLGKHRQTKLKHTLSGAKKLLSDQSKTKESLIGDWKCIV